MRTAALLVSAGLVSAGLVGTAPTAQAVNTCTLAVPSRVALTVGGARIRGVLYSDCQRSLPWSATWQATHPTRGTQGYLHFVAIINDGPDVDDWQAKPYAALGRWTWQPKGVYDPNGRPMAVTQNRPYSDVKLAAGARLAVTRSGSRVTLTSSAFRYWPTQDRIIAWAGSVGQMQWKVPGTTTWRPLKDVRSNASGKYTFVYKVSVQRDYRVYFPATSVIWNAASPTVRR